MICPICSQPMQRVRMTPYETLYKCHDCHRTELRNGNGKIITELKEEQYGNNNTQNL